MPFNPNATAANYAAPQPVTHESIPPNGRRVVTADFAFIYINGTSIGLVQRFSPTESRPVQTQFEIGNIYPVEFVPAPWSGRISVSRLEIFKNALYVAFGFGQGITTYGLAPYWPADKFLNGKPVITTLADIQWPLDIQLHIQGPPLLANPITVKTFQECWITEIGSSYDAGAKIVAENVSFVYRNIAITEGTIGATGDSGLAQAPTGDFV